MKVIRTYEKFNWRRYGDPWVAAVDPGTAKIDFGRKAGGYTGGYNSGEAGELYVTSPQPGAVYAYGQKDYRGNGSEVKYVQYSGFEFVPVEKTRLVEALNAARRKEEE